MPSAACRILLLSRKILQIAQSSLEYLKLSLAKQSSVTLRCEELMVAGPPVSLAMFLTAFLGSIFILFPFFPALFLAPRLWRFACDRFVGFWLSFPVVRPPFPPLPHPACTAAPPPPTAL